MRLIKWLFGRLYRVEHSNGPAGIDYWDSKGLLPWLKLSIVMRPWRWRAR